MSAPEIADIIARIQQLPSLPAVVAELMATTEQEDLDLHALADKIALDQALTARTLRLANSSFYGLASKVTSIQQAISVLGFHSIRTLVTACAVTASFTPAPGLDFDFEAFWRHSIGAAVCARALAPRLRVSPESAFTAGLLHDLGTLVLATRCPEQYRAVEAYRRQHDCSTGAAQLAVFGFDHAAIGSALAERWQFPAAIQQAVAAHHQPPCADHSAGDAAGLASAVYLANVLAHALDLSGQEDDQAPPLAPQAWAQLRLSDSDCFALFREAEQVFDDMRQILVQ